MLAPAPAFLSRLQLKERVSGKKPNDAEGWILCLPSSRPRRPVQSARRRAAPLQIFENRFASERLAET